MKKIYCICLSIVLIISLCACSKANVEAEKPKKKALIELDVSSVSNTDLISIDSDSKYSVLFYSDYVDEYAENIEEIDIKYYISVFNVESGKLIKTINFENKKFDGYNVVVGNSEISLFNMAEGEMITYDINLENRVDGSYRYEDIYAIGESIEAIDTSRFNCYDGYAISSSYGKNQALIFYDDVEKLYMVKSNIYYDYNKKNGHNILVIDNSANQTDKLESVVRIFDFDNQKEINSVKIPNNYQFNNIQHTSFNDEKITVSTVNENGSLDKVYVWDYKQDEKNTPFDNGYCEMVNADEINSKITEACDRIKEKSGVTVECLPDKEFINQDYEISNDVKEIVVYQAMLDLEDYLSVFPKETYQEITCKDIENPISRFDDFRIYLVGDFPNNDIDAFANNICSEETENQDIVYIVYSISVLNQKTFFHEIMHTFEYRIWNYEENFDEEWLKLNPDSFDYTEDYGNQFYDEKHEDWQDYFARDYGMKNILEDRATCFEELCDGILTDSCWWKEKPQLLAKQKYLYETLQKAFPSLIDSKVISIE